MLPALRDDLIVYPGPSNSAGQPSWTIHDPMRNRFFRIDWLTFEVLGRWSFGDPEVIAENVSTHTTLHATDDDVRHVSKFLIDNELIRADFAGSAEFFAQRLKQRQQSWTQWLLHHYLFIRIPLVRPDAFLERSLKFVRFFGTATFFRLTLVVLLFGLWQMFRQSDLLAATFIDQLNFTGFLSYAGALIAVKILHELGHGFVSKYYGCRVPTMGVALLVLWPVAYTDTTETWKLDDKYKRLRVACAGVATELTIAAWATAFWALLPDGVLRDLMFMLATTTWVSAVLVNFNPLMRFDGYYILSDWLDIPNLHDRAFALARWQLRRVLLGVDEPPPESFTPQTRRMLIGVAWITWIYRLGLYLGIAFLVYHFFIKLVGILLFVVEMWFFILRPIVRELHTWWAQKSSWIGQRRFRRTVAVAGAITILLFVPWPSRVTATAVIGPEKVANLVAPESGQLTMLPKGAAGVDAGQTVAVIDSSVVGKQRAVIDAQVESLRRQVAAAAFDPQLRSQLLVLQSDLAAAEASAQSIATQVGRLALRAPFAGRIVDIEPDLQAGDWIAKGTQIAVVVGGGEWRATAYLSETEVRRISVGDRANFVAATSSGGVIPLVVEAVEADSTRMLPDARFSTLAGGDISVRQQNGRLVPENSIYRVRLKATDISPEMAGRSWRGHIVIRGKWSSVGLRYLQAALAVLVREAGF